MTIIYKNLMWLKNTPLKDFVALMETVTQNMDNPQKERFVSRLWEDVALMRHTEERRVYGQECKV